jgi:hypothetical protein
MKEYFLTNLKDNERQYLSAPLIINIKAKESELINEAASKRGG